MLLPRFKLKGITEFKNMFLQFWVKIIVGTLGIIINACNDTHDQNKRKSLFKHEYLKHKQFSREKSIVQTEQALLNVMNPMICLNHYSIFSFLKISMVIESETEAQSETVL